MRDHGFAARGFNRGVARPSLRRLDKRNEQKTRGKRHAARRLSSRLEARRRSIDRIPSTERAMDAIYLLLAAGLWALTVGLVHGCRRLAGGRP